MNSAESAEMSRLKSVVDEIQRELHPWVAAHDQHLVLGLKQNITLSHIISDMKEVIAKKIQHLENRCERTKTNKKASAVKIIIITRHFFD